MHRWVLGIHPLLPGPSPPRVGRKPKDTRDTDGAGNKHKATAFSWEKTDKAEELKKAAKLK